MDDVAHGSLAEKSECTAPADFSYVAGENDVHDTMAAAMVQQDLPHNSNLDDAEHEGAGSDPPGAGQTANAALAEDLVDRVVQASATPDTVVRLQKARIRSLQQEVVRLQAEVAQSKADASAAAKTSASLQQEKAGAGKARRALEAKVAGLQSRIEELESKLELKENVVLELTRDGNKLDKERRKVEDELRVREVKLDKAMAEMARYKTALDAAQAAAADRRTVETEEYERLQGEVHRLQRQKAELLSAFRKALRLVDVLRRQKVHLEAQRVLAFTEAEFMKTLEGATAGV